MAQVQYRPVREDEIPATIDLFQTALADLYKRNGVVTPLPERSAIELHYRHIFRTGIFHVAEVGGRLAAIGHAIVRDQLWFLSGFWALPELQGKRIGGTLLRQVRDEGERLGARKFFTWSSIDLTAMASYMRAGMLPGYQTLTFAGTPDKLPEQPLEYEVEALELSIAARIDAQVRETGRETDHEFWLTKAGHEGRQVRRDGEVAGYYYFNQGLVGPAAWLKAAEASTILTLACREAAAQAGAEALRLMIPGINHAAINFALQTGLRLTAYSHLLTSAPFGQMEQYLPSGPSLF
jgi:GNAT superfamily N-acetyltransferase